MIRQSFSSRNELNNDSSIKFQGLTDLEGSKQVAKRLMELYDRNRDSNIDRTESVPMLVDVYRTFNKQFNPSSQDIDSFYKVFDRNRDGKITLSDMEELCQKYLVGGPMTKIGDSLKGSQLGSQQQQQQQQQQMHHNINHVSDQYHINNQYKPQERNLDNYNNYSYQQ